MAIPIPGKIKQAIKGNLKKLRQEYQSRRYCFDSDDLAMLLCSLGIQKGDTVMVHSGYEDFIGFSGKPSDVVANLISAVGKDGLLMMPTMPFLSTAVEFVRRSEVFDIRRTPSRMGIISEIFRRSPDVRRSTHPTHPVAVWGIDAEQVIDGHQTSSTPCGAGTPFEALLERNGKILFLGTDIGAMTFFHHLEEKYEKQLPISPFTEEVFPIRARDSNGREYCCHTRLYEPAMSRRRQVPRLIEPLKAAAAWNEARVGKMKALCLDARAVEEAWVFLSEKGIYCYE